MLIHCLALTFQSKKILDNNFDKLPLHGLGKGYSANWWKALAGLLIAHGNINISCIFTANSLLFFCRNKASSF